MKRFAFTLFAALVPVWLAAQPVPPVPPVPPAAPVEMNGFPFTRGGFLGVGIQEITTDRAKALKLKEEAGVEITSVRPDSPAEKAGLKSGDVILQYNGARIEGMEQFSRMVRETPVGRDAKLLLIRNGAEQTVSVKIGSRSSAPPVGALPFVMPDIPNIMQGMHSPMLGVDVESISGQFAEYFGVKEGLLVRGVMKSSAAEKGGIKAGDVILRIDDSKVVSPREIGAKLRSAAGKAVPVAVMRDHKELSLTVDVPDRRSGRATPVRWVMVDNETK